MFCHADLTDERLDISATWCAVTGEAGSVATAYFRAGAVAAVSVRRDPPVVMCRAGAAAIMSDEVVAAIEARARGWVQ